MPKWRLRELLRQGVVSAQFGRFSVGATVVGALCVAVLSAGSQLYLRAEAASVRTRSLQLGVQVLVLSRSDGGGFVAEQCEALTAFDGVVAAGRRGEPSQIPIAAAGGDFILTVQVTSDYFDIVSPSIPGGAQVVIGERLSERFDWADGRRIDENITVSAVANSERDPLFGDVLSVWAPPGTPLESCWLELSVRDDMLAEALSSAAGDARAPALYEFVRDPDERLQSLARLPAVFALATAVLSLLVAGTSSVLRKTETALFRTNAVSPAELALIRLTESALLIMPALITGFLSVLIAGALTIETNLIELSSVVLAVLYAGATLLLFTAIIEFSVATQINPLRSLKWNV